MSANEARTIDLYNASEPFLNVYPHFNTHSLPSWLQENIAVARVYGNKKRCVILPDGRKYHLDNKLNCMTGKDWTLFINSVFSTHYPTRGKEGYAHEIRKLHPSPKPPQLMRDIIQFFTKENELVFDSFVGVGGTLLGAALCGRTAAGIELNAAYLQAYKKAAKELSLPIFPTLCGDSLSILKRGNKIKSLIGENKISLLLIDPPYSNMMAKEKTGGDIINYGKTGTPFTKLKSDLGNMSREHFLASLRESVELAFPYMKAEAYVVVFIKDLQPRKKEINLLHSDVIQSLNQIPKLYYKGMKIWADTSTKLYPYGYPFSFVANQIHQYILVFRKEK